MQVGFWHRTLSVAAQSDRLKATAVLVLLLVVMQTRLPRTIVPRSSASTSLAENGELRGELRKSRLALEKMVAAGAAAASAKASANASGGIQIGALRGLDAAHRCFHAPRCWATARVIQSVPTRVRAKGWQQTCSSPPRRSPLNRTCLPHLLVIGTQRGGVATLNYYMQHGCPSGKWPSDSCLKHKALPVQNHPLHVQHLPNPPRQCSSTRNPHAHDSPCTSCRSASRGYAVSPLSSVAGAGIEG